jgi:hypothetical protein
MRENHASQPPQPSSLTITRREKSLASVMLNGISDNGNRIMKPSWKSADTAFTLVELLAIIVCTALLAAFLFPALFWPRYPQPQRINCTNNLKQIGLAFKTWALDNDDKFPMHCATNGGTLGMMSSGAIWRDFRAMSNELSTPKILVCPADNRTPATNFDADLSNAKISYFVGLDWNEATPQMFLSGDRNLTNGTALQNCVLVITPSRPAGWTHTMHKGKGNILCADGSVQQVSSARLVLMLSKSGDTNHLAIP